MTEEIKIPVGQRIMTAREEAQYGRKLRYCEEMFELLIFILNQVEKCDPIDGLGHKFMMNKSIGDAKELIQKIEGEK